MDLGERHKIFNETLLMSREDSQEGYKDLNLGIIQGFKVLKEGTINGFNIRANKLDAKKEL